MIRSGVPSAIFSPASRTAMRSEKRMTARMMCPTLIPVVPAGLSRNRISSRSSTSELVSPAMASSEISSEGLAAMARASSSLRISIWVSREEMTAALVSSPTSARISRASLVGSPAGGRSGGPYSGGSRAEGAILQGDPQVLEHGHAPERPRDLERSRDPQAGSPVGGQPGHLPAAEEDPPRLVAQRARDAADQRGLARPVGADQPEA